MEELESRQEFFGEKLNDDDMLAELDELEADLAKDELGNLAPQQNIEKVNVPVAEQEQEEEEEPAPR